MCDSGIAGCYTGRSVSVAAAVIRAEQPTIVTLNEACRGDVSVLRRAAATNRGPRVLSAFKAVPDRATGSVIRCSNGEPFGIGVLVSAPSSTSAYRTYSGVYPTQDPSDPEERVWLCLDVAGAYLACTTHAANTSPAVALAQCRYFFSAAVPMIGGGPLILGADLNLPAGGVPDPQSCLPPGYQRLDDGARQDIVTSAGIALLSRTVVDMQGATDHPGLFVELSRPHGEAR